MNERRWLLVGLLALGCFADRGSAAEKAVKSAPRWLSGWEEGRKVAGATGKPLFVVFRCQH